MTFPINSQDMWMLSHYIFHRQQWQGINIDGCLFVVNMKLKSTDKTGKNIKFQSQISILLK